MEKIEDVVLRIKVEGVKNAQMDIDSLTDALGREIAMVSKSAIEKNRRNQIATLTKQINDAEEGSLGRLAAEYELAMLKLNNLSNAQRAHSDEGLSLQKTVNEIRDSMIRLKEVVDVQSSSMGESSTVFSNLQSNVGQLTNSMVDLAVNGSSSLSTLASSLTPVYASMAEVANQTDKTTGKQMGWSEALKAMGSSLFSYNTLVSIGVQLLAEYGDDIYEWAAGLVNGADSVSLVNQKLTAMQDVLSNDNSVKNAIQKQVELEVVLRKAKEGTYDSNAAVKMYNETLGTHYGKVNNVTDAMNGYAKNSKAYIDAVIAQAAATKIAGESADLYINKQNALMGNAKLDNIKELKTEYEQVFKIAKETPGGLSKLSELTAAYGGKSGYFMDKNTLASGDAIEKAFYKLSLKDNSHEFLSNVEIINDTNSALKENNELLKTLINKSSSTTTTGGSTSDNKNTSANGTSSGGNKSSTDSITYDSGKSYNHVDEESRFDQHKREKTATSEEMSGVKISFDQRIQAAEEWLDTEKKIYHEDQKIQTENAKVHYKTEKAKLDDQLKNASNKKKALAEYNIAIQNLNKEHDSNLKKIESDYNNSVKYAEEKKEEWLTNIKNQKAKENIDGLKESMEKQNAIYEDGYAKSVEQENKEYEAEKAKTRLYGKLENLEKKHQENLLKLQNDYQEKKLANEIQMQKDALALEGLSSKEKEDLSKNIFDNELKLKKLQQDKTTKTEQDGSKKTSSIFKVSNEDKKKITDATAKAISAVWSSYYSHQSDKINHDLKNKKKALDKEQKQEIDALEKRHQKGLISDEDYEKQKQETQDKYDAERDKAEREAFEKTKQLKIKQAAMDFATGVIKIWSSKPNPITAAILTALLTATTAANIATIKAQQYAKGGLVKLKDGLIMEDQNVPTQSNGDNVLAYVKRGEVVLNEKQQKALGGPAVFRAIGVPGFASGGVALQPYESVPIPESSSIKATKAIVTNERMEVILKNQMELMAQMLAKIVNQKISTLRVGVLASDITRTQNIIKTQIKQSKLL